MRHLSRPVAAVTFVVLVAIIAACGGHSSAPTAPTDPAINTGSTSGAVITGTVLGSSATARALDTTGGATTVSVVGTNLTVNVSVTGQFTITGVPSGDITLKFHGASGDATITVTQVTQGETINITVTIQGTTATAETETRDSAGQMQVEGRIEAIDTTAKTFVVAGKTISTDGSTTFMHGGTPYAFADLQVGWRVHVAGTKTSTGVLATRVEVQNTNGDIKVNVNGTVSGLTGTASAFQFSVGGTLVKGDTATAFTGKNSKFTDLANGGRVEVKGQQKNGFVYATSIHIN